MHGKEPFPVDGRPLHLSTHDDESDRGLVLARNLIQFRVSALRCGRINKGDPKHVPRVVRPEQSTESCLSPRIRVCHNEHSTVVLLLHRLHEEGKLMLDQSYLRKQNELVARFGGLASLI